MQAVRDGTTLEYAAGLIHATPVYWEQVSNAAMPVSCLPVMDCFHLLAGTNTCTPHCTMTLKNEESIGLSLLHVIQLIGQSPERFFGYCAGATALAVWLPQSQARQGERDSA